MYFKDRYRVYCLNPVADSEKQRNKKELDILEDLFKQSVLRKSEEKIKRMKFPQNSDYTSEIQCVNAQFISSESDSTVFRSILYGQVNLPLESSTDNLFLEGNVDVNVPDRIASDSCKVDEKNWYQNCDIDNMFRGDCMLPISPRPSEEIYPYS